MVYKLHGWLILDKPLGMSSAQAVARVKRIITSPLRGEVAALAAGGGGAGRSFPAITPSLTLPPQGGGKKIAHKIGHAGTLDPLASGILPLALGEATKTVQYCMDHVKSYRFTVTWGESRATDDAEGEITGTHSHRPTEADIHAILPRFTGRIRQTPPAYSAIKITGERAYALARAGEAVEMPEREVEVYDINPVNREAVAQDLIGIARDPALALRAPQDETTFEVTCGKGTYIRSLARDMALALGTLGYVSALRRTRVGKFGETHAISLENLEKMVHTGGLAHIVRPVESVLDDIPAREIDSASAARLRQGQALPVPPDCSQPSASLVRVHSGGVLVAICEVAGGLMKPVRVFNLV